MPEAVQVFIAPPSREALRARLVGRGTDDPEQVAARGCATAEEELAAAGRVRPRRRQRPPRGRRRARSTAIVRESVAGTRVHSEP